MTAPAFQLPTEADDIADLAAVGIIITPTDAGGVDVQYPTEAARIDAAVSETLRQLAREQLNIARYDAACKLEVKAVQDRYARLKEGPTKSAAWFQHVATELARNAPPFPGKAKSRSVAFGTYGKRKKPEHISITDDDAVLAWAEKEESSLVDVKEVRRVLQAGVEAYYLRTKKVPPGCTLTPETNEPFVKPDLTAAATTPESR